MVHILCHRPLWAAIRFHYEVFSSYESGEVLDSSTVILDGLEQGDAAEQLVGDISFRARSTQDYLLVITAEDVYRKQAFTDYIRIRKTDLLSRQNFLLRDAHDSVGCVACHDARDEQGNESRGKLTNLPSRFAR